MKPHFHTSARHKNSNKYAGVGVKHVSTRRESVAVIKPLTLLLQDTLITLQLLLKVSSYVCIVRAHLHLLCARTHFKLGSVVDLSVASQAGFWGVKSLVFTNTEILNLITGMCYIICARGSLIPSLIPS